MLLVIYGIPAVVLGAAVGRWWVIALPPAGWSLTWCAFVVAGTPRGEGFNEIYAALGVSSAAGAALGVGVRKACALARARMVGSGAGH